MTAGNGTDDPAALLIGAELIGTELMTSELTAAERVSETVLGPLLHDLRGALGVVRLASQLLEESQGNSPSLVRIQNACRRLAGHFEELRAEMRLLQVAPSPMSVESGVEWASELAQRIEGLRLDHPRRVLSFRVEGAAQSAASLAAVSLILSALVDGAVKTTPGRQAIDIVLGTTPGAALTLEVRAENSQPSEGLRLQLATPAREWSLGSTHDVPFRLILADQLAVELGGSLQVEFQAGGYRGRLQLPSPGATRASKSSGETRSTEQLDDELA